MKFVLSSLVICFYALVGYSQKHKESFHHPSAPGQRPPIHNDTTIHSIRDFFTHGQFHGHARNYFMLTINEGGLKDYYANATGGALAYKTAYFKGLQFGIKGIFTYNIFSSDFTAIDSASGKSAKYEVQLFDVQHPNNKTDLDRLEELFVKYAYKNSYFKYGKMDISTPLVNPQDGRMKPYVFSGFWGEWNEWKNLKLNLGWFNHASPRSITHWYTIENAIGLYNEGVSRDGSLNEYKHQTETAGLGIGGFQILKDSFQLKFWNYYLDNINNTVHLEITKAWKYLSVGIQQVYQHGLGQGGNEHDHYRYYTPSGESYITAARLAYTSGSSKFSLNYLKGYGNERFIFPREFGREHFFTTVPRGRIEGLGMMESYLLNYRWEPPQLDDLQIISAVGFNRTPGYEDYQWNKYGYQSHYQAMLDVSYAFHKVLRGSTLRLLYITKWLTNNGNNAPELIMNRVNYHQINLVFNIYF